MAVDKRVWEYLDECGTKTIARRQQKPSTFYEPFPHNTINTRKRKIVAKQTHQRTVLHLVHSPITITN